ncbi:HDOD domain-containing protein [Enterovibrio norvegicus FF-454]|uniref:HDOD domain-containing protein n=1 Tax=Enterovibrio norvegicus FF-454 TaxID=1185651 RepID=A0A1E5C9L2_9GAMM|nr:HDOD domain-containing protein [Enterovibrio norvegicus]OEE62156.1 HDOD domain-containing protein [Enterovibrio norvegicus FF-454]
MTIDKLLSHVDKLPKIPKVVQELMDLVNSDGSDMNQISTKIAMDQVISARVLRLSNSSHFGRGRTVASVDDAVIRLGLGPIRTLVTASALMSTFPKIEGLDLNAFWGTTFEVATFCKAIAKELKSDQNEAFTAGMLHNIGDLLIYTVYPDQAQKVELHMDMGKTKPEAQQIVLSTDGAELGGMLAKNWKFADTLIDAISHQYSAVQGDEFSQLAAIINLSRKIDCNWEGLADREAQQTWLNHQLEYSMLGLNEDFIDLVENTRGVGRELASSLA